MRPLAQEYRYRCQEGEGVTFYTRYPPKYSTLPQQDGPVQNASLDQLSRREIKDGLHSPATWLSAVGIDDAEAAEVAALLRISPSQRPTTGRYRVAPGVSAGETGANG